MVDRPRNVLGIGVGVALCLAVAATPLLAEVLPSGLKIEKVLDNAAELGDLAQSPLGELWLLEKSGTVRVLVAGTEHASLAIPVTTACESGLLDVAFAPDYGSSGLAFIYYVDGAGNAKVDEIFKRGTSLELGANILDLGTTAGGCEPGGGLDIGADGKLYVAVGDLETPSDAQDDGALPGKVLRAELDGSVPGDNASGTLVWAKGFRNGADMDIGANGMVYMTDLGYAHDAHDELNAVHEGGNYGWDMTSGDSGGAYDDPLTSDMPTVGPAGMTMLTGDALGADQADTLMYTCAENGELRQAVLTGAALDQLDSWNVFYDSMADADGTPDAGCPDHFNALGEGGEGWLYGANSGANPGIWRLWRDDPGPREVSAPGSPFPMTLNKAGARLEMGWENLGPLDSGRPTRHADQHARPYQIWEGDLANVAAYEHVPIAAVSGTSEGPARLVSEFAAGAGDKYFLISAQGENLEGTTGYASDGTPRGGEYNYCDDKGYLHYPNNYCAPSWRNPNNGEELRLRDYNPNSPYYNQLLNISDFRGKVIRMDISSDNCYYCNLQAPFAAAVEDKHHARDFIAITVLTLSYSGVTPIPPASCQAYITGWANSHGVHGPIVCDVDMNGDNHGDVSWQYWRSSAQGCGGTPHNYYVDQGHTIYSFICGGELSEAMIYGRISAEINPDFCE